MIQMNNEKIAEIRHIVEQYEHQQNRKNIIFKTSDEGVKYILKAANIQAIEVAKLLLSELDRMEHDISELETENRMQAERNKRLEEEIAILIEGLLQIGHDHGLKHTVNGILKEAEVEERVDYGVLE